MAMVQLGHLFVTAAHEIPKIKHVAQKKKQENSAKLTWQDDHQNKIKHDGTRGVAGDGRGSTVTSGSDFIGGGPGQQIWFAATPLVDQPAASTTQKRRRPTSSAATTPAGPAFLSTSPSPWTPDLEPRHQRGPLGGTLERTFSDSWTRHCKLYKKNVFGFQRAAAKLGRTRGPPPRG